MCVCVPALRALPCRRWQEAKKAMEKAHAAYPSDTSQEAILKFMAKHDFVCPPNWKGYRSLDADH